MYSWQMSHLNMDGHSHSVDVSQTNDRAGWPFCTRTCRFHVLHFRTAYLSLYLYRRYKRYKRLSKLCGWIDTLFEIQRILSVKTLCLRRCLPFPQVLGWVHCWYFHLRQLSLQWSMLSPSVIISKTSARARRYNSCRIRRIRSPYSIMVMFHARNVCIYGMIWHDIM